MEIISQRLSTTALQGSSFKGVESNDDVATEAVQRPSSSGKTPASVRVLDALKQLSYAQEARLRHHEKAVAAFSDLARPGKSDGNSQQTLSRKTASLEEALAGVKLSAVLDQPREVAATRDLLRASDDLFGVPECAQMACDDPAMENILSPLLGKDLKGDNLGDIWNDLADKIKQFESGALDNFSKAAKQMKDLFDELTKALAGFDKWMTPEGDNQMKFTVGELRAKLEELRKKYPPSAFNENNTIGGAFDTEDAAKEMCNKLQMDPGKCVSQDKATGKWYVSIDTSMLDGMISGLPGKSNLPGLIPDFKEVTMSLVAFNAWKTTFDNLMNRIEDATQERGQKYSNVYSRFESFHKTILSIIQAFTDMMRSFFPF